MPPPAERLGRVRTKIVATLGPSASTRPQVLALARAGADTFRLNFSHGTHAWHDATLRAVREASDELGSPLGVLQDLCGPKIRLGDVPGGSLTLEQDQELRLAALPDEASPVALGFSHPELLGDLREGDPVAVGDGVVLLRVIMAGAREALLRAEQPGTIRSRQGLNLPHCGLSLPALTQKDLEDLDWAARQGAHAPDWVALSFVRRAADVRALRGELALRGIDAHVVAKIEKPQALENIDEIIAEADAIMVARGDLALETDVARVPAMQKRIIAACHAASRPVITATQMLASMEHASVPTRAEASDVFNAVLDGSDALMLSAETAVGAHPALAVSTMSRILTEAERLLRERGGGLAGTSAGAGRVTLVTGAIVAGAAAACAASDAALLVVATHSGRTALAVSKRRQGTPTLAVAILPRVARRLALYWGVVPLLIEEEALAPALERAFDWAREQGLLVEGDHAVLLEGSTPGAVHDALRVREVR